jgi:hypothetical protein
MTNTAGIAAATVLLSISAAADQPPAAPKPAGVVWALDVRESGKTTPHPFSPGGGSIPLPDSQWKCTYGAITRSKIETSNTEVVAVTCTHDTSVVSSDTSCTYRPDRSKGGLIQGTGQVRLSLTTRGSSKSHLVLLSCVVPQES